MSNRYDRNILIRGIGEEGQERLRQSRVLVIGAGGLGSPVLLYLVAAGVGIVGIVDYDKVDESNLQRQIIHYTPDIGKTKVQSATEKLTLLNSEVKIDTYTVPFSEINASELVCSYDFIVDCCDNYETKFLINDVCVRHNKPYSHGSVLAMRGEAMTFIPGTACYRCLFDTPPKEVLTSEREGILGAAAGVIGSIQAMEAIKYLTCQEGLLTNRILIFDGKDMNCHTYIMKKQKDCICGAN